MIITYFGKQFFKIQQGEMVLAFNPISKNSKVKSITNFGADLALISMQHPDYNGVEQLSRGDRSPFVIDGPGDYEVKDIFIKGLITDSYLDNKKYINTIYSLIFDGINIVFLGVLSKVDFTKEIREKIGDPDILFIPADDNGLLNAKEAAKLAFSFEPKIIIPMDYTKNSLETFLKEIEAGKIIPVDKITLKKKDLENKKNEVVVLKSN